MPDELEGWITTAEAAKLTGYNVYHVRRLAARGRVKAEKFGRDWFVDKADILAYVQEIEELGPAKFDPWRTGARQKDDDETGKN